MKRTKISLAKSTRLILIGTATILLPLLTCNFADARGIKVGIEISIKYKGQTKTINTQGKCIG